MAPTKKKFTRYTESDIVLALAEANEGMTKAPATKAPGRCIFFYSSFNTLFLGKKNICF